MLYHWLQRDPRKYFCTYGKRDPPPFEKQRLRQISAYNFSTVRDSEKFKYEEYKVDHGLSNELYLECVRYP